MSRLAFLIPMQGLWGFLFVLIAATDVLTAEPPSDDVPPTMNLEERRSRAESLSPNLLALKDRFEARSFRAADGSSTPYRLFKPASDNPDEGYPLVVFLHGSAGRGTDNLKQISGGNIYGARVWALPENQAKGPCFVLAPQLMEGVSNRRQMEVKAEKVADTAGSSIAGRWRQLVDGPSGQMVMQLSLEGEDDSLSGSLSIPRRGTMTLENISHDGGTLTYTTTGGLSLRGEFTVRGRRFAGKLSALGSPERAETLLALIQEVVDEFSVDRRRIYITGQSMGGSGTWGMLAYYPDFFAAAVPVCGTGNVDSAKRIVAGGVNIWTFHGSDDPRVPVDNTRTMLAALREAGGRPRYTEYAGVKHDSWIDAYLEPNLHGWLFEQTRPR